MMRWGGRQQRIARVIGGVILGVGLLALGNRPVSATPQASNGREVMALFRDEMQAAPAKLKWRGERLTDDTLYALALTGFSWNPAWGKERRFSRLTEQERAQEFETAMRGRRKKEALTYALSLILDPGTTPPEVHREALDYLTAQGVDFISLLTGILAAPEKLPGLPAYTYAAADLLALYPEPELRPFLLHLVESDDVHLRSRALIGLGALAYRARPNDPPSWSERLLAAPLREYSLSAFERRRLEEEVRRAAQSDKYRLRVASVIVMALTGDEAYLPDLQKLAKDRAYLQFPLPNAPRSSKTRQVVFPVRLMASVALARFGMGTPDMGLVELSGKALDKARRGNQDVTNDQGNLRRDYASWLVVTPLDRLFPPLPLPKGRK